MAQHPSDATDRRACALCDSRSRSLTREHALPTWTGERVPGEGPWTVEIGDHHDPPSLTRPAKRLDMVTRAICRPCHEVLNHLENWARGELGPLIDGSTPFVKAAANAQLFSASWAVKTVMLVDLCLPDPQIPSTERHEFFRARRPRDNTLVWWASYTDAHPGYRCRRRRLIVGGDPSSARQALYAGLRLGHLAFLVAINLSEDALHLERVGLDSTGLGRIWPPEAEVAEWPPDGRALTRDGFEAHTNVELVARAAASPPPGSDGPTRSAG